MSCNIKDFWLRFDGEPGTVTGEGAELDRDDLEKLEIIAAVINEKKPDVIGILECASLAELLFFNERFLEDKYRCWIISSQVVRRSKKLTVELQKSPRHSRRRYLDLI